MRYRSKPSEIEAVQWTGDNLDEVIAFAGATVRKEYSGDGVWRLQLFVSKDNAQKWVNVKRSEWIVRRPDDMTVHWPVNNGHFARKYEPGAGYE